MSDIYKEIKKAQKQYLETKESKYIALACSGLLLMLLPKVVFLLAFWGILFYLYNGKK